LLRRILGRCGDIAAFLSRRFRRIGRLLGFASLDQLLNNLMLFHDFVVVMHRCCGSIAVGLSTWTLLLTLLLLLLKVGKRR
jgi:hypothetical protein